MKAIVCHEYGIISDLQLETIADPVPASDELLLKVLACGINFADALLVQGLSGKA